MPDALRSDWEGDVLLTYRNTGNTDIQAPLIVLRAANAQMRYSDGWNYYGSEMMILGISRQGPAGSLPPGASESVKLVVKPTVDQGNIELTAGYYTPEQYSTVVNWNSIKDDLRPEVIPADAWDAIYANYITSFGSNIGQFYQVLLENASYLSSQGVYTTDVGELVYFEFLQGGVHELARRFTPGAFGRGFPAFWETTALLDAGGDAHVKLGSAVYSFRASESLTSTPLTRSIQLKGKQVPLLVFPEEDDTSWHPAPGNYTQLVTEAGVFKWRSEDGTLTVFQADGKFNYLEDKNGNRVTAVYSAGRVVRLDYSNGDQVQIGYTPGGVVQQLTDPTGRATTFTYDGAGEHLTRITTSRGSIHFTYTSETSGPRQHAITQIAYQDGSHHYFEYDSLGRLAHQYRDGGVEEAHIAYTSPGGITFTDVFGTDYAVFFDAQGLIREIDGPLGESFRYQYDRSHNLTHASFPQGASHTFTYDTEGNLILDVDPLGNQNAFVYDTSPTQPKKLLAAQDGRGNTTQYSYDTRGNLTNMSYPDASQVSFAYDALGRCIRFTNARGQTIEYQYNQAGLLIGKDLPGGIHLSYSYDAHRNLVSASGPGGSTTYEYNALDQLTKVTYPNGRWLAFEYNSAGRRSRISDQSGYGAAYTYDAVGRLAEVRDLSNQRLAAYTYDIKSRLTRQDNGNGTYTSFEYDVLGQVTRLSHYTPGGSLIGRFEYVYDLSGRRTQMTTAQGAWLLGYDLVGQLTSVQAPGGRQTSYTYDAAGNRTQAVDNGVTTSYAYNELDELTQAGSAALTYDADGNLVSRTEGSQTWSYTYDAENQLRQIDGPDGLYQFEYDALGNRINSLKNGVPTQLTIDPAVPGLVFGEYDGSGTPLANNVYGYGLISRKAAGSTSYYHFDGAGNTATLSGPSGVVQNTYTYLPFGEILSSTGSVDNPYVFGGRYGMRSLGSSAILTQARLYDPILGRFAAREPLAAPGENPYHYAYNNPLSIVDFDGLKGMEASVEAGVKVIEDNRDGLSVTSTTAQAISILAQRGANALYQPLKDVRFFQSLARYQRDAVGLARSRMLQQRVGAAYLRYGTAARVFGELSRITTAIDAGLAWKKVYHHPQAGQPGLDTDYAHDVYVAVGKTLAVISPIPFTGEIVDAWDWATSWVFSKYFNHAIGATTAPGRNLVGRIPLVFSADPNDILGPGGYGADHWIPAQSVLPYTIRFENAASATAPAQVVRLTQALDADVDLSTFEWTGYGFGSLRINLPPGLSAYRARLDLRSQMDIYVDVTAELDYATRTITWEFTSIDPVTGMPPRDPYAGFLPPNQTSPQGEGYVTYSLESVGNAASGTRLDALATIVFDTNAPIDTPPFHNLLDGLPPAACQVAGLPARVATDSFTVSWTGSDDPAGSGIGVYDIFVSIDSGTFQPWLQITDQTSAIFDGEFGHHYAFYCRAIDNVGHMQPYLPVIQAQTTVAEGYYLYLPVITRLK